MREFQVHRVECMAADREAGLDFSRGPFFVERMKCSVRLVELIANQRMSQMGEVNADLMVAPCQRSREDESLLAESFEDAVQCF